MQMMSVKQYAEKMASSASQIRQMCANGILPSVKIGKSYKIDVARADEFFRQQIDARLAEGKRKQELRCFAERKPSKSNFLEQLEAMKQRMKKGA